VCQSNNFFRI